MKNNVKELRKVFYNLSNGVITEGDLKDFDFYGNYKYKLPDSNLPFPNGEDFGPSTGNFEKTDYGYINYTFIGKPRYKIRHHHQNRHHHHHLNRHHHHHLNRHHHHHQNRYHHQNGHILPQCRNVNLYHMNKPCRNQKDLSKLNIIMERNDISPNINIPYGITDVEFFYKGQQHNTVNKNLIVKSCNLEKKKPQKNSDKDKSQKKVKENKTKSKKNFKHHSDCTEEEEDHVYHHHEEEDHEHYHENTDDEEHHIPFYTGEYLDEYFHHDLPHPKLDNCEDLHDKYGEEYTPDHHHHHKNKHDNLPHYTLENKHANEDKHANKDKHKKCHNSDIFNECLNL